MLIQNGEIAIRFMQDEMYDYDLMAKWLTNAKVSEFYEGRDNSFPYLILLNLDSIVG
ncbi:hypothetical protein [Nostoc sp.]|uniref:hypothetical protein n=1 Tax=Nostoc sp. TaxID=1180 RepID=UPI002FF9FAAD